MMTAEERGSFMLCYSALVAVEDRGLRCKRTGKRAPSRGKNRVGCTCQNCRLMRIVEAAVSDAAGVFDE
jgi:hypothetical protein